VSDTKKIICNLIAKIDTLLNRELEILDESPTLKLDVYLRSFCVAMEEIRDNPDLSKDEIEGSVQEIINKTFLKYDLGLFVQRFNMDKKNNIN